MSREKVSGPLLNSVGRYSSAFTEGHSQTKDCNEFLRLSLHSLLTPGLQRTTCHKATTMPTVDSKNVRKPDSPFIGDDSTKQSHYFNSHPIPTGQMLDSCWRNCK